MKRVIDTKNARATFPIAIVASRFNQEVTQKLYNGAMDRLEELDFRDKDITVVWVPGAIEIPLITSRLASAGEHDAIVCLGAVIQGETDHYQYVCDQVSQGCKRVALDNDLPVIFGVLTTQNKQQALERAGGTHGHKGKDAIDTAVQMVCTLRELG